MSNGRTSRYRCLKKARALVRRGNKLIIAWPACLSWSWFAFCFFARCTPAAPRMSRCRSFEPAPPFVVVRPIAMRAFVTIHDVVGRAPPRDDAILHDVDGAIIRGGHAAHRAAKRRLAAVKHALAVAHAAILAQVLLGAAPHDERAKPDVGLVELYGRQAWIARRY